MESISFLDHRRTSVLNSGSVQRLLTKELFAISSEFAKDSKEGSAGKRKRKFEESGDTGVLEWQSDDALKKKLEDFVRTRPELFVPKPDASTIDAANEVAKAAAANIPSAYFFQNCQKGSFSNHSEKPNVIAYQNREFLLPPNSYGLLGSLGGDVTAANILEAGESLYGSKGNYDLIVMDPPWLNKSVKRQRRYMTGSSEDILSLLSMEELLAENGLLVVWYTHNESHYRQLKKCLEDWRLRILANWTWLKVTTSGAAICPFGRNFKKPYEHLLLAARAEVNFSEKVTGSDGTILVSVPSAIHSHKPNLDDLLEKVLGKTLKDSRCLELYARSLKSNWVCVGNEVMKLQCTSLFSSEESKDSPLKTER